MTNNYYDNILLACHLYTSVYSLRYSFSILLRNAECFDWGPSCLPGCNSSVCLLCVKHCTIHVLHSRCVRNQHADQWASSFHGYLCFWTPAKCGRWFSAGVINPPISPHQKQCFVKRKEVPLSACFTLWQGIPPVFHCSCIVSQHF